MTLLADLIGQFAGGFFRESLRFFAMASANQTHESLAGEKELVKKAKRGDEQAFTKLYHHYFPLIYRYIYRRCGHEQTTEDLTSQVFLKAFEKLPRFQITGAPFGAWVYRIAANLLTDYYRKSSTKNEYATDVLPERPDTSAGAHQEVISAERKEEVLLLLSSLSKTDRKIIELRFFAELSVKEISSIVELTPNAVSVRIHRGLKKLYAKAAEQSYE